MYERGCSSSSNNKCSKTAIKYYNTLPSIQDVCRLHGIDARIYQLNDASDKDSASNLNEDLSSDPG